MAHPYILKCIFVPSTGGDSEWNPPPPVSLLTLLSSSSASSSSSPWKTPSLNAVHPRQTHPSGMLEATVHLLVTKAEVRLQWTNPPSVRVNMGLITGEGGHLSALLEVVEGQREKERREEESKNVLSKQSNHNTKTNRRKNNSNNNDALDSVSMDRSSSSLLHCQRGLSARLIKYIDLATGLQCQSGTRFATPGGQVTLKAVFDPQDPDWLALVSKERERNKEKSSKLPTPLITPSPLTLLNPLFTLPPPHSGEYGRIRLNFRAKLYGRGEPGAPAGDIPSRWVHHYPRVDPTPTGHIWLTHHS